MIERIGVLIALGEGEQAKDLLHSGECRSMIVDRVIDDSARNKWGDDDSRYAHAQLCEIKSIAVIFWVGRFISWGYGLWRRDMVIKAAVFVICDDEQAIFPVWRVPNRLVNLLEQGLAACNVILRMLRIAADKIRGCMIIRLDKSIGSGVIGIAHVALEIVKVAEASLCFAHDHAADRQRLRKEVSPIERPANALVVKSVVNRAIIKFIAVEEDGSGNGLGRWTVIQPGG